MNIFPIKPPRPARSSTRQPADTQYPKVIAITSGKGGVGKTNVTSNLAIALAKHGNRVCIFDADTSLANINIVMGLSVEYTVEHLLAGERTVDEIMVEGPEGVMVIPAASGIAECANLDQDQRDRLIAALESLEDRFDYILIDTAAGIGDTVLSFVQSAQYAIVVISTEPTSLTDAFALLRVLRRRNYEHPVYVLVNMAINYANSMEVFKRFEAAVKKYLNMKVHYLGYITEDKAIRTSVSAQRPVLLEHPESLASRCFTTLATVLSKQFSGTTQPHSFSAYWNGLTTAPAPTAGSQPPVRNCPRAGRNLRTRSGRMPTSWCRIRPYPKRSSRARWRRCCAPTMRAFIPSPSPSTSCWH
ncbi:MAG: MinD/ParA family protein [Gammaproteobacteria bacterium]|nr:MinD/ParA family protein [Gammaproteobacteria bacterium]